MATSTPTLSRLGRSDTALRAGAALMTLAAAGFVAYISHLHLAVALPAHYPYNLDTLGHLGLIYLATVIFVAGALAALVGLRGMRPAAERGRGAAAGTS